MGNSPFPTAQPPSGGSDTQRPSYPPSCGALGSFPLQGVPCHLLMGLGTPAAYCELTIPVPPGHSVYQPLHQGLAMCWGVGWKWFATSLLVAFLGLCPALESFTHSPVHQVGLPPPSRCLRPRNSGSHRGPSAHCPVCQAKPPITASRLRYQLRPSTHCLCTERLASHWGGWRPTTAWAPRLFWGDHPTLLFSSVSSS